jgi:hypothetical protein
LKILKRLREFEEIKSQGKAVEVTVNNKRICLDFVKELGLYLTYPDTG